MLEKQTNKSKMDFVTPELARALITRVCIGRPSGFVSKIAGADTLIIYDTQHDTCIRIASPHENARILVQAPEHILIVRERLLRRIAAGELGVQQDPQAAAGAA